MEPRFINSYTLTESIVRQFKRRMLKPLLTAIPAAVLGAIMLAIGVYARESHRIILGALLFLLAGAFVLVTESDVRRTWKMMCEQASGKPIEVTLTFGEEKAVNETHGLEGRIELDYADIKKVLISKDLIILVTKAKLGHILRRGSFTLGDEKSFLEFINGKRTLSGLGKGR